VGLTWSSYRDFLEVGWGYDSLEEKK
jgi:hypothetical protein